MENEARILWVSLRYKAVYVPKTLTPLALVPMRESTVLFAANLATLGFGLDERLLQALNQAGDDYQTRVLSTLRSVMRVEHNWTPLVKDWLNPTGETYLDHIVTLLANLFDAPGQQLPCGHIIPPNTFPLGRYNGCPFCGTPFERGEIEVMGRGSKLKILVLWQEAEVDECLRNLLISKTALDATQVVSLKLLLQLRPLPKVKIGMKETLMLTIDQLIELNRATEAQGYFRSPTDILRYLWYKHTGFLQIVEPKTIVNRKTSNFRHYLPQYDRSKEVAREAKSTLKLKYGRKDCKRVAQWLNGLEMGVQQMAAQMHPKREMWIRFIRALRLTEYAKQPGMEKLGQLLEVFYHRRYEVVAGQIEQAKLRRNWEAAAKLLKSRPGMFARSLFANMLWFGPDKVVASFEEIVEKVPARLVFSLQMYADFYFEPEGLRPVKPLGGVVKSVAKNRLLRKYDPKKRLAMQADIEELCLSAMRKRFAAIPTTHRTMYIDPQLFKLPMAIGDRGEHVQDLPAALMGQRFPVEGNEIRLFMQWGVGLPAQHLDMDLSCQIISADSSFQCSYFNLAPDGFWHSGDIRSIPDQVGTAEYIEIDLKTCRLRGVKWVVFTCNAYSSGALSPNLVVGWMNSSHPMHVSETTGVAYDPSCVQHQVRITRGLTKGLAFGILDVERAEVVWLEMPFSGQTVLSMNAAGILALMRRLEGKLTIGNLLKIKAEAQGLAVQGVPEGADEVYDLQWAMDTAAVTQLLVD
jgi:hypothetical protein